MRPGFRYAGGLLGGVLAGVVFASLVVRIWPAPPALRRACPVMAERGAPSPLRMGPARAAAEPARRGAGLASAPPAKSAAARSRVAPVAVEAAAQPSLAEPPAVAQVWSNRHHIASMLVHAESLWVATHGGVERYGLAGSRHDAPKLERVYTTLDGLDTLVVRVAG